MSSTRGLKLASAALALCASACANLPIAQPQESEAYANFLIARVANLSGDYRAASDRYSHALRASPHNPDLLSGAVTAALATGDLGRARALARSAPQHGGPVSDYAYLVRAADDLSAGRYRQAQQTLEQVDGDAAQELMARLMLTSAEAGAGQIDAAASALDQLSGLRQYGALFEYQRALAFDAAGRNAEAAQAYARAAQGGLWLAPAVERHADLLARTNARAAAAALLAGQDQRADSEALARAAARLQAGQSVAQTPLTPARGAAISLFGLGAIFLQEDDSTRGLAALSLALMLDPQFDAARLNFAEAQSEAGHYGEARAMLDHVQPSSAYYESARIDGADWRLFYMRAAVREKQQRWADVEADLQAALRLAPDQPDTLNFLGYMWVDRGEHVQEGLAMIQRALDQRPSSAAIIDSLGWAYYRLGDFPRALDNLERAVELEPADATLNDHLGDVYWQVGRYTEARFQWRRALALTPDNAAALEAKLEHGLPQTRSAHR